MKRVINSLHWCHRFFWYSFAVIAILLAIAISLTRVFITDVKDYRQEIESFASSVLEQEVRIDSMDAKLSGFTPLIVFNGVRMMDNAGQRQLVRFEQARLTIDTIRSLTNLKIIPKAFTVSGVSLGIHRNKDGILQIQGLNMDELSGQFAFKNGGTSGASKELADWLFKRSDLAIKNSTVVWQDETHDNKTIQFQNVNFNLRNDNERHQLTGTVTLPRELGQDFEIAFDFKGNLLNPREWQGHFFSKGKSLNLQNWNVKPVLLEAKLQTGTLDVRMWGQWYAGTIQSFSADFSAEAFQAAIGVPEQTLKINHLTGLLDWQRKSQGWRVNVNRFRYDGDSGAWPQSRFQLDYQEDEKGMPQISAYASYFRIHDARDLLSRTRILQQDLQDKILALKPQGEIQDLIIRSTFDKQHPQYHLSGKLQNVSIAAVDQFPGIQNFSGEMVANEEGGYARINVKDGKLIIPKLFREPLTLSTLDARLDWWYAHQQWYLKSSDTQLANDDINGSLSALLRVPDDKKISPYLDLQLEYQNGQGTSVYKYLPVTIMDKELVGWLDKAFKSGLVTKGGFVFNGRLRDFPFKKYSGVMLADFYVRDIVLDYQTGWPTLRANDGHLMISGHGIDVRVRRGQLYDSQLRDVHVSIDRFTMPRLNIHGSFNGKTRDLFRYLVNTPIASEAKGIFRHAKINGEVSGALDLHIPLSNKVKARFPLDYNAKVSLENSRLDLWDNKLVVENISGDVAYKPKRITSNGLKATLLEQPVSLKLFSRTNGQFEEIQLTMRGRLDANKIRQHIAHPLVNKISGITDWQGVLSLGTRFSKNRSTPGYFYFISPLKGVASNLPVPLYKSAQHNKQLKLQIDFPDKDILPVYASLGKDWSAALAVDLTADAASRLQKASVVFFDGLAQLPKNNELLIKGSIPSLPINQWQVMFKTDATTDSPELANFNLPIQLDMDYLKIEAEDTEAVSSIKDPRTVFLVNGEIRQLEYNETKVGKLTINTRRKVDGIRIDNLSVTTDNLSLSGEGNWTIREGKQLTNMILQVSSDNMESLLASLGYSATIRKGKLQSVIQTHWYGAPTDFSVATLNGNVGAVISDGIISEIEPGAGRLLGLLSLSELPRRLKLDFSEFRNGLAFSQIIGQSEISDGIARIDTLKVISPVALMRIEGKTNLVEKTFDQTVRIVPNVSGTAPVVSWLALGSQAGAVVFLLDQLFGDKFNNAIGIEYAVTGSWDNPIMKKIQQNQTQTSVVQDE